MSKKKIYVLTFQVNAYDQEGEYFLAAFESLPSIKTLAEFMRKVERVNLDYDIFEAVAFLEHLRAGGGRRASEDLWYNLNEVELQ